MTAWKNLHFRPPLLKPYDNDRASDLILIRSVRMPKQTVLGRIILRSYDSSVFHLAATGYKEISLVGSQTEWTEVPT